VATRILALDYEVISLPAQSFGLEVDTDRPSRDGERQIAPGKSQAEKRASNMLFEYSSAAARRNDACIGHKCVVMAGGPVRQGNC
jgi:hypothetical protein